MHCKYLLIILLITGVVKSDECPFFIEEPKLYSIVGGMPESMQLVLKAACQNTAKKNKKMSRLLLHGPAGVGKSVLAETFVHELGAKMIRVHAPRLLDPIDTDVSVQLFPGIDRIHAIFKRARQLNDRVVIFIDDVDFIACGQTSGQNNEFPNTLLALLEELDQCALDPSGKVFVILATSKLAALDPALLSRFSNGVVEIKNPTGNLGLEIIEHYLTEYEHEPLSKITKWWIMLWTRGFSVRDYENMVLKAALFADGVKISKNHLLKALNAVYAARIS